MKFLTDEELNLFIQSHDYDIRKTGSARWIDQKCTPDVLCFIADCILEYTHDDKSVLFTSKDIWYSNYALNSVKNLFKKVNADADEAENEYDKFFSQPIKLLGYAGVLKETKKGRKNLFKIENEELLQYISIRERNALEFLYVYINKVLKDSGLKTLFDEFFMKQNNESYYEVKRQLLSFNRTYTKIGERGSDGKLETNRIFIKILNTLAFKKNKLGTYRGHISKHIITYDELMYNRNNFRDIYANKPKDVARKTFAIANEDKPNEDYFQYQSNKAKKFLKWFNNSYFGGLSEVKELEEQGNPATQMHHIFPAGQFPEISGYYENIIALTPNQHFLKAHPNNNTQMINRDYQYTCLMAKSSIIEENLTSESSFKIYEFNRFLYVIRVGLDDESYIDIDDGDYTRVRTKLNVSYNK